MLTCVRPGSALNDIADFNVQLHTQRRSLFDRG
jgi:hypothetical protein